MSETTKPKRQKRVALFSAPNCHWCVKAKSYFKSKGIKFNTIDISKDKRAKADCERHGCRGVPVILVENRWICGFDKNKIDRALGL